MGMYEKMKEEAMPLTNTKVTSKVVKTITRSEIEELNNNMAPIIDQNKKEYREMAETINKNDSIYSSNNISRVDLLNEEKKVEEFTDEKAELMAYQFNKYISSCTAYLMDRRLKEKRALYNGTDDGFVSKDNEYEKLSSEEKVKTLLECEEVRDFNGINSVIRSTIKEINKENYEERKNNIKQNPEIFIDIYYEEELDSIVIRMLYDDLSIINQFCPILLDKNIIEDWINNTIEYISKIGKLDKEDILNKVCQINFKNEKSYDLKTNKICDEIYNYIHKLSIEMSKSNLDRYREIMENYRNGEYGITNLSLSEILTKAGYPNLMKQMSIEELDELINDTYGMSKEIFINLKKEKMDEQQQNSAVREFLTKKDGPVQSLENGSNNKTITKEEYEKMSDEEKIKHYLENASGRTEQDITPATKVLSEMLQNGKLQGPEIIQRWRNRGSKSEEVIDDFMEKLEDNYFDRSESEIGEDFNPTSEFIEKTISNYNKLLESGLVPAFEEDNTLEEKLNNGVNCVLPYPIGTYLVKKVNNEEHIDSVYKYVISSQGISVILLLDVLTSARQSTEISLKKLINEWEISDINYLDREVGPVKTLKNNK